MITSQPIFIPLYFDETETDLWLALQRVEPEERSSFIKGVLRQVLLGNNSEEFFRRSLDRVTEDIQKLPDCVRDQEAQTEQVMENRAEQIESFSLEDLFAQTQVPPLVEEPASEDCQEVQTIPGFEYLMKCIIGTEEDEALLMLLKQRTETGSK